MGTIIVGGVLIVAVVAVIHKMRKDKKAGKSTCGCNCSECHGNCH